MDFRDWRRLLKIWAPPLIGLPAMLLLGYGFEVARLFLFAHHLFWIMGIILLINPVAETVWPSPTQARRGTLAPRPSTKAQARREAQKLTAKQKPASETPTERLARLQRHKEALDQKIKKLTPQDKEQTPAILTYTQSQSKE